MNARSLLLLSALALAPFGCSFTYVIQPEEMARATRELVRGGEARVRARASDGREVIVRLERDARINPLDDQGSYLDESELRPADRTGVPRRSPAAYEYTHRNLGVPLLAGGLGLLAGGIAIQGIYGLDEAGYAIPLVGPVLAMQHNFTFQEEPCSDEAIYCFDGLGEAVHRLMGVGNLLTLLMQVAGMGVAVGGAIAWRGAPEGAIPPGLASADTLTFTLEPISYGDGGGGGAFTLRF
ncbi:MAG TPA: hypothetical protein PK668_08600 [Myxococcota bacterium]|nr:hypothetical protein [Myxococcota bacterium]HRY92963.1 hypothetical protein [Myxococcota bacterium]HSA22068.1 hypothetical protein [Myxococcota bacterium]